ncbi:hypothetical protein MJD09_21530, partial [bacterium]|nr:hypothetical protein [bacterium]
GLRLPISTTQSLGFEFEHKGYEQTILRDAVFEDSSRFFLGQIPLPFGNLPFRQEVDAPILDTEFYSSNDISLSWQYTKLKPTVDALINPSGGRRIRLGYARLNSTITDSLVQVLSLGVPGPSNLPARRDFPINEYSIFWQEFISLPFNRHTLGFETFTIYRDQRLPEFDELTNIDGFFPLRLYLGGQRTLRGYPYFTRNGSKIFFSRINYTFPIFKNIGKQFLNMYFDRLYGSIFFEGGTTWNFEKVSIDNLKATTMLYDAGLELRMSLFSYYRIPGSAYFQIAWPLTRVPARNIDIGDQRIYFGIRLGGL